MNQNVLGITNVGRKQHGKHHWMWAIWISVDASDDSPKSEPTATGFSVSHSAARSNALRSIKEHALESGVGAIRRDGWVRTYNAQQRQGSLPEFSRCKIGKQKWLWVVQTFEGIMSDKDPIAHGTSSSAEEAHEHAVHEVGPVELSGNWIAEHHRRRATAIRRSEKRSQNESASQVELVYECYPSASDFEGDAQDVIVPHRVVKKTAKLIGNSSP